MKQFPQYTMEWAIPAGSAQACLRELRDWIDAEAADPQGLRVHWPIEIRWTSGDDIWLSPSEGEETCWIGVVTYRCVFYRVSPIHYFRMLRCVCASTRVDK
jgi:hypothetical protein